jgi:hypothetical protein
MDASLMELLQLRGEELTIPFAEWLEYLGRGGK